MIIICTIKLTELKFSRRMDGCCSGLASPPVVAPPRGSELARPFSADSHAEASCPKHATWPRNRAPHSGWPTEREERGDGHTARCGPGAWRRGEWMRVPIGRRRSQMTGNKARDRRVNRLLRARGWKVVRIWEHELSRKNETRLLRRFAFVGGTKPGRA